MYFGVDYYPEHWPTERWKVDARLMREANINIVRMAEFAWSKLEPKEGQYDFTWLDEVIEILATEGIKVILGTPTATPPKWLMDKYPDIYMRDAYGRVRGFGSRRHYCYNNNVYQEYTKKITSKMAEYYKDNANVIYWQIDNEFGCHDTTYCYCDNCLEAFREWLKCKYGTIEVLNEKWGTVFWSQTYNDWDEIILPTYTACEGINNRSFAHNPGMLLDFRRFSSDSVVAYQKIQIDILREKSGDKKITHNLMGHFSDIDYFNLGQELDFISWDNYPGGQWGSTSYPSTSMAHDLMRGIKEQNFWVMEQKSGPCGWSTLSDTPKPGLLRLWTYQALAHGAEAIVYFRWRACRFGTEQYWYGILDHDGIPRRRYKEIKEIGEELKRLSDWIVESENISDVAIVKSYDNLWSHGFQPHNSKFDYNRLLMDYYNALAVENFNVDMVNIWTDLSKYKVVFIPAFNLMQESIKEKLDAYVKQGGTLVTTFRSGTRNWDNSMTDKILPGELKDMAGIEVEEFDSISGSRQVKVKGAEIGEGVAGMWCDIINPIGAQVLASYTSDFYQGKAAITLNNHGKGRVYYIGCDLNPEYMRILVKHITGNAEAAPALPTLVEGVETVRKQKNGKQYIVVLNHNDKPVQINIPGSYDELITGEKIEGKLCLSAYEVAVLM